MDNTWEFPHWAPAAGAEEHEAIFLTLHITLMNSLISMRLPPTSSLFHILQTYDWWWVTWATDLNGHLEYMHHRIKMLVEIGGSFSLFLQSEMESLISTFRDTRNRQKGPFSTCHPRWLFLHSPSRVIIPTTSSTLSSILQYYLSKCIMLLSVYLTTRLTEM